jgi:hypothetical protein
MTPGRAALALTLSVVLAVWAVLTPGPAVDGRGVLALVLAVSTLAIPMRETYAGGVPMNPEQWARVREDGRRSSRGLGVAVLAFALLVLGGVALVVIMAWPALGATVRPEITGSNDGPAWIIGGALGLLLAVMLAVAWRMWLYRHRIPWLARIKADAPTGDLAAMAAPLPGMARDALGDYAEPVEVTITADVSKFAAAMDRFGRAMCMDTSWWTTHPRHAAPPTAGNALADASEALWSRRGPGRHHPEHTTDGDTA